MSWDNSTRRSDLPSDWASLRLRILDRDHWVCRIGTPRCTVNATEVDHTGDRTDHREHLLRAACHPCHALVTGQQSTASRVARRTRPVEPIPGLR